MRLLDIIENKLEEVSMSPGALKDFANTEFAQSMIAGFEAELIIPNVKSDDYDDYESEPDYGQDERIYSTQDILDFFVGDYNSTRQVQRAIDEMNEQFFEDASDRFEETMYDDILDYARSEAKSDGLSDEEIEELFSEADSNAYEKYMDNARDELQGQFFDSYSEDWIRENYPNMSDFHNRFGVDWPHWTTPDQGAGENEIAEVAKDIQKAIGMEVKASGGYHSAKRGPNYFILEPDSSIDADADEGGLELVSPPMPLNQCLEYLDKVFAWAKDYDCRTDESTGFHMGISIPGQTMENVDHVKFTLFLGDEYVLRQFGRESNTYARSMLKKMRSAAAYIGPAGDPYPIQQVLDTFKAGLNTEAANMMKKLIKTTNERYVTVNIKANYIEVRSAGGDYLGDLDKIKLTLLRYVRAMGLAADPEAEKQEYAKKLYKFLSPLITEDDTETLNWFSLYSAGAITQEELKMRIRRAEATRAAKKIPPTGDKNKNWIVKYQSVPGGPVSRMQTIGSSVEGVVRSFQQNNSQARVLSVADIHNPEVNLLNVRLRPGTARPAFAEPEPTGTVSPAQPTSATAGTYIIQYQDPNGLPHSTALDANSAAEAEQWFRSNHPSSYRILNTFIS